MWVKIIKIKKNVFIGELISKPKYVNKLTFDADNQYVEFKKYEILDDTLINITEKLKNNGN